MRELVRRTHDELVKGEARVEGERPERTVRCATLSVRRASVIGGLRAQIMSRVDDRSVGVCDNLKAHRDRSAGDSFDGAGNSGGEAFFQHGRGERTLGPDHQAFILKTQRLRAL